MYLVEGTCIDGSSQHSIEPHHQILVHRNSSRVRYMERKSTIKTNETATKTAANAKRAPPPEARFTPPAITAYISNIWFSPSRTQGAGPNDHSHFDGNHPKSHNQVKRKSKQKR